MLSQSKGLGAVGLFIAALFVAPVPAGAKTPHQSFHGYPVTEFRVTTQDGATLSMVELRDKADCDIVLIQPGLIETAETFDDMAVYFRRGVKLTQPDGTEIKKCFNVIIEQARYVGRGPHQSRLSPTSDNGLEDVLIKDTTAALRYAISRLVPGRKLHVIGHSKGGMQILAMFNQPALNAEFAPHLASATLLTAPDRIEEMPWYVRRTSEQLIPWLERLHALGIRTIDFHHSIFEQLKGVKSWGMLGRVAARLIERPVAYIAHEVMIGVLLSRFTSSRETRRLVRQEISVFPVKLLLDFAHAVVTGQLPVPLNGNAMTVPTQVVSAEYDRLVRRWHQQQLFMDIKGVPKRWVMMEDTHHVDPAVSKRLGAVMLPKIAEFMVDPEGASRRAQLIEITREDVERVGRGECEALFLPRSG